MYEIILFTYLCRLKHEHDLCCKTAFFSSSTSEEMVMLYNVCFSKTIHSVHVSCYAKLLDILIIMWIWQIIIHEFFWESCPELWFKTVNKRLTGKGSLWDLMFPIKYDGMELTAIPGCGKTTYVLLRISAYFLEIHLLYVHVCVCSVISDSLQPHGL